MKERAKGVSLEIFSKKLNEQGKLQLHPTIDGDEICITLPGVGIYLSKDGGALVFPPETIKAIKEMKPEHSRLIYSYEPGKISDETFEKIKNGSHKYYD